MPRSLEELWGSKSAQEVQEFIIVRDSKLALHVKPLTKTFQPQ